ncbi:hypothetical protein GCM10011380_19730 [Sphingomonas metalli]|uniref:DUF2793 domain-containing protein n=1 Tax=Sphingomonas metalli TaxID=1779358 RepID=A0A916T4R4_9SPHN|nr:DUF2793 domain-containing protein [Sphingomonas metalli]GGB30308.1 hypothetical protein GCM10011380_19730 [Sphingomonas metalli]
MANRTARLGLPLIEPDQAQKELTHNEALVILDTVTCLAVGGAPRDEPPGDPAAGQCWIVGPAPRGAWAGRTDQVAAWTSGGWRFVAPQEAMVAWDVQNRIILRYQSGAWKAPASVTIPAATGGGDGEARQAIAGLAGALRAQGLLAG